MVTPLLLFALCINQLADAAPATTQASLRVELAEGEIYFLIPDGLELLGKRIDDLSASVAPADKSALITITIARQQTDVVDALGPRLGRLVIQTIEEQATKGELEIVTKPKIVRDKRFLVTVADRFRAHGRTGDRVQHYRGIGKLLISVTATAFTEDPELAKATHNQGTQMMLSVKPVRR